MNKVAVGSLIISSSLALAACTPRVNIDNAIPSSLPSPTTTVSPPNQLTTEVNLDEQNNSNQSGTVTLTQLGDNEVKVMVALTGGNFTAPQPAHIHVGSCPTPGKVQYPLNNVVNGKSETTLNVSMDQLLKSADKLAINVHKSATEQSVYTACGNLK